MKIAMARTNDDRYEADNGFVLAREYGKTPNGNPMGGRWVLRDDKRNMVDFDQYSNDIAERHNLRLH